MVVWVDDATPVCLRNFFIFVPSAAGVFAITIRILANVFTVLPLQVLLAMVLPNRKAKLTLPHIFLN